MRAYTFELKAVVTIHADNAEDANKQMEKLLSKDETDYIDGYYVEVEFTERKPQLLSVSEAGDQS